jgi:hypothetical protein
VKSYREFIIEAKLGDCFKVAGRAMLDADEIMEQNGFTLVHALVEGEGSLKGRKFFHGFNMLGDVVFDNSNGNKISMRKESYFKNGGINPKLKGGFVTYNKEETLLKMLKTRHWGPWDLNFSLEENIPDEKREIGKKRLRVSPQILKTIKNEIV